MLARLSAFVIWALVAATAVFWGLRLMVRAPSAPSYAMAVGDAAAARGDLTSLLGAAPMAAAAAAAPAPEAASRFRLLGIVAPKAVGGSRNSAQGVALIAVDGKMPRAYQVGSRLDGDLVLQSVSLRTVSIGSPQGAPPITLELPPLAAAATGPLPAFMPGGLIAPSPMGLPTAPMPVPQYVPPPQQQPMMPQDPPQFAPPPAAPQLTPQPPGTRAPRSQPTLPSQ